MTNRTEAIERAAKHVWLSSAYTPACYQVSTAAIVALADALALPPDDPTNEPMDCGRAAGEGRGPGLNAPTGQTYNTELTVRFLESLAAVRKPASRDAAVIRGIANQFKAITGEVAKLREVSAHISSELRQLYEKIIMLPPMPLSQAASLRIWADQIDAALAGAEGEG